MQSKLFDRYPHKSQPSPVLRESAIFRCHNDGFLAQSQGKQTCFAQSEETVEQQEHFKYWKVLNVGEGSGNDYPCLPMGSF
jgi:hypothetical protein